MIDLEKLTRLAKEATPGPRGWFGNANSSHSPSIYLATVNQGRRFIMMFARWGFKGAQPRFQTKGRMQDAKELLKFEVCPVVGIDAARTDGRCYRYDVDGIDHPDAEFIAACSTDTILALVEVVRCAKRVADESRSNALVQHLDWIELYEALIPFTPEQT